jgi:hypothetical protein
VNITQNVLVVLLLSVSYRLLVRKPEGRRPLGRPGLRWEDNIEVEKCDGGARTRSIWLRIGTSGGLL